MKCWYMLAGLTRKYFTKLDKRSSLFSRSLNDEEKSLMSLTPGGDDVQQLGSCRIVSALRGHCPRVLRDLWEKWEK